MVYVLNHLDLKDNSI